jgi:hypothetical protein
MAEAKHVINISHSWEKMDAVPARADELKTRRDVKSWRMWLDYERVVEDRR